MKMLAIVAAVFAVGASSSAVAGNVGVSITIDKPGLFGQINLGGIPTPQLIFARPLIAVSPPYAVAPPPIYLHVPPGYERHWRQHCGEYHACERPVFFVQDRWYRDVYVPQRRDRDRRDHDRRYRDQRDQRDHRDHRDSRDHRDNRDNRDKHDKRDHRDHRDHGDHGNDGNRGDR
ncbi:MAG TPA: hypothetical protein VMV25_08300 [Steroidobacteraceae bacterium]|nr:hypothetical protein [Steroidobacteraceae bacterium]